MILIFIILCSIILQIKFTHKEDEMKKVLIGFSIFLALLFIGCGSSSSPNLFKSWNGKYISVNESLNSNDIQSLYDDIYSTNNNYTKKGAKSAVLYMLGTRNINSVTFIEDKITFNFTTKDGGAQKVTYSYKAVDHNDSDSFHKFKCIQEPKKFPEAKYILMTKPHQDEGSTLTHFHLKYGARSFKSLEKNNAYPTFVPKDTSIESITQNYLASKDEIISFLPKVPLNDWVGTWNSLEKWVNMDKPEYDAVYDRLIAKYKGKNSGGDYTKEEIKKILVNNIKSKMYSATITKDSNVITVTDNEGNSKNIEYKLDYKKTWTGFVATTTENPLFKKFLITIAHRGGPSDPWHFHFQNSDTEEFDALSKKDSIPTMLRSDSTTEQVIKEIESFANYYLSSRK